MEEILEELEILNQANRESGIRWIHSVREENSKFIFSGKIIENDIVLLDKDGSNPISKEGMIRLIRVLVIQARNFKEELAGSPAPEKTNRKRK